MSELSKGIKSALDYVRDDKRRRGGNSKKPKKPLPQAGGEAAAKPKEPVKA